MSKENIQTVQSFYDAMSRGDVGAVLGLMAPDIEWTEAENFIYADNSPYVGPDNVLNGLFMRFVAEWDGFKAVPEKFVGMDDTVVVLGRYSGTVRETGRSVDAQMVHVFTVGGGKLLKFRQYTDTAQFRDAVR